MDSFRRYISRYGIPLSLYMDLHSTYRNNNKKLSIEEQLAGKKALTQFSRALDQLSVTLIPAFSPQAKGRVERSFQTFQDRLCKELHRHNINSMKDANTFLETFLKDFNRRFSINPKEKTDLHRPTLPVHILNKILCKKTERSIGKDFTIRHDCRIFQLSQSTIASKAIVEEHTDGKYQIRIKHKTVLFKDITHKLVSKNNKSKRKRSYIDPISLKEVA